MPPAQHLNVSRDSSGEFFSRPREAYCVPASPRITRSPPARAKEKNLKKRRVDRQNFSTAKFFQGVELYAGRSPVASVALECHRARKQCHAHTVAGRVFQGEFQDFGVSAVVKNASSTRQKTCETGIQREAALSESLPRALSALCASIRVLCEVLLGQKDKKRQFALVKSGMAVFNITIGLPQILLMPISL